MKTRIMYIENKNEGWARIGRVSFSKTGRTIYYNGKQFQSSKGKGVYGNYHDVDTDEEYWISGPKKNGEDAHYAEPVEVHIDDDVLEEYWREIRNKI